VELVETEFTEWDSECGHTRSLSAREESRLALYHLRRNSIYRYHTPVAATLTTLPQAAGHPWTVEEYSQRVRNEAGPDHYQARP
jgi:hypothetical protein